MDASKYPFDFAALKPGDLIDADVIEKITGVDRKSPKYWQCQQRIRSILADGIEEFQDWISTIKSEGPHLRILKHNEAAKYNPRRKRIYKRQLIQTHRRNMSVDMTQLTAEEQQAHLRELQIGAAEVLALKEAKKVALKASKRPTPGLLPTT